MTTLFSDNAQGYLSETAEQSATVLSLSTGEGIEFPDIAPGSGDQFFVRIGTNLNNDVIRIVNRVGDLLYPDVPLARRWPAGTEVALTVNTRSINALRNEILSIINGITFGLSRNAAVITSNGNFTWPDVGTVKVTAVGGAGGGGGARKQAGATGNAYAGRGGYGSVVQKYVAGTPGEVVTCVIGQGGAGGSATPGNGGMGEPTSFGTYVTANGGPGGSAALATAGDLYAANGADFVVAPVADPPSWGMGAPFAIPHAGYLRPNETAPSGKGYGSPGLGAISTDTVVSTLGGAGTQGLIIVEW